MWTSAKPRAGRHAGLTLLEVLAAVALLGIVFTALSRSAALGVLSEGDSRRRLEAALLADSRLAALELEAGNGVAPELGLVEEEFGDFHIEIETLPWTLPDRLREEREAVISSRSEVFGDGSQQDVGIVREIHLRVVWDDGVREREIERTTFAVDFTGVEGAAALLLPSLPTPGTPDNGVPSSLPDDAGSLR